MISAERRFVRALQPLSQHLQLDVLDSESLQLFHRRQHVVAARTRATMSLPGKMQLVSKAELAGVLAMAAIEEVTERVPALLRVIVDQNTAPGLAVDASDTLRVSEVE